MSGFGAVSIDEVIRSAIRESIDVKIELVEHQISTVSRVASLLIDTFRNGGKLVLFGNGGSAADAQHVAAEFVNRFRVDRVALPAIALITDTSVVSSIANDAAFDQVFARQVQALVRKEDMAVGISTSGNSSNVLNGIIAAREIDSTTVGFSGHSGGKLKDLVHVCLRVPSDSTPRIQEAHIAIWHAICEAVDREMFSDEGTQ